MKKKALIILLFAGAAILVGLQSCDTTNHNPTVPAPVPTATPTP